MLEERGTFFTASKPGDGAKKQKEGPFIRNPSDIHLHIMVLLMVLLMVLPSQTEISLQLFFQD